jgi:c(7)-type cytochrome triheme protein
MSYRWLFLTIPLMLLFLPSVLHAVGMGEMGGMGMGRIVDKVHIQTKTVGEVVFSHSVHGTRCNSCHPKIFQKKSNSNHVSMKAMEKGKSCGACHNGKTAFNVTGDCVRCHAQAGDIIFKDKNVGKIVFPHAIHIEQFSCGECHPDLFKAERGANKAITMKEMKNGASCGACHDGSSAFSVADCVACHAGDILYKDEDAGNVTFSHAVHIEQFSCSECHPDLFKAERGANKATMEDMENGKSCGACHDGSSAFSVADDCESCHQM